MQWHQIYGALKCSVRAFSQDKVSRRGAALAYYSIFSMAPLLVILLGIASLIFGERAAEGKILDQIEGTVGPSAGQAVQDILRTTHRQGGSIAATIVGLVLLLFGASRVFVELQEALDNIWHVTPNPGRGWGRILRERFLSFVMVVVVGFLFLASLIVTAALLAVSKFLSPMALPGGISLWQAIDTLVSLGFITVLFALLFKTLPNVKLGWRDVWISALVTAALFTGGKFLIGLYLTHTVTASAFGVAGSLVILLLWVYYSSQIVLFGAELTRQFLQLSGRQILPEDNAIPVGTDRRPGC
jgi:membrane protein